MGMDMTLSIVKNKEYLAEDIFPGRNTEWFCDMMGRGNNNLYNFLPRTDGVSPQTPDEWSTHYSEPGSYFGLNYISVSKFIDWYYEYCPQKDAGWVTTYEKWEYETRGVEPELLHFLPDDVNMNDMHFIEIENAWNPAKWLYDYLTENDIPWDADTQYCFDN